MAKNNSVIYNNCGYDGRTYPDRKLRGNIVASFQGAGYWHRQKCQ